jgi:transcriptional regulator with PAS, ATPase and Fis domain
MNERYAKRFGLKSADEAIGQPCEQVISNSLLRQVVRNDQPILLDIQDTPKGPLVVMRLPIHNDAGAVIGAIGFALFDELRNLSPLIERYLSMQQELASTRSLLRSRQSKYNFAHFIGTSAASLEVKRRARRSASAESPVLLLGETGTGKELLAQAIHGASSRAHKAFVSINSAAIPADLLEAEFFGTAPGAFTGADRKGRPGKFQIAQGGTLFLDEIGDMPLALQTRLLRVLEDRLVVPLGGEPQAVNVRIISATHRNLLERVQDGSFREDLYYRLNGLEVGLPPLRERSDKSQLLDFLLAQEANGESVALDPSARGALLAFAWPGNVRQLRTVLRTLVALCEGGRVGLEDLTAQIRQARPVSVTQAKSMESPLEDAERLALLTALQQQRWHMTHTAEQLGVSRNTLYRKLRRHGIARHALS